MKLFCWLLAVGLLACGANGGEDLFAARGGGDAGSSSDAALERAGDELEPREDASVDVGVEPDASDIRDVAYDPWWSEDADIIAGCPDSEKPTGPVLESHWCSFWLREIKKSFQGTNITGCCRENNVCGKVYKGDNSCRDLWDRGAWPYPPY